MFGQLQLPRHAKDEECPTSLLTKKAHHGTTQIFKPRYIRVFAGI